MGKITKSVINALKRAGLDYKLYTLTDGTAGVMVLHDYYGIYPQRETFAAHDTATAIATRRGLRSEQRGHYTGTLIYTEEEA